MHFYIGNSFSYTQSCRKLVKFYMNEAITRISFPYPVFMKKKVETEQWRYKCPVPLYLFKRFLTEKVFAMLAKHRKLYTFMPENKK